MTTRSVSVFLLSACFSVFSTTAMAATNLPYYDNADFEPRWFDSDAVELVDFHRIPPFRFTNQRGEAVTDEKFAGKIFVANFFFSTCPGICPGVRSKLVRVQETFLDDPEVLIVSHSIRPKTDSVQVLSTYAKQHGVNAGKWDLLTGDQQAIYQLAKSSYFASEDLGRLETTKEFLHTENLLLIDKNMRIRGVYNGLNAASVSHLIEDIRVLKSE